MGTGRWKQGGGNRAVETGRCHGLVGSGATGLWGSGATGLWGSGATGLWKSALAVEAEEEHVDERAEGLQEGVVAQPEGPFGAESNRRLEIAPSLGELDAEEEGADALPEERHVHREVEVPVGKGVERGGQLWKELWKGQWKGLEGEAVT